MFIGHPVDSHLASMLSRMMSMSAYICSTFWFTVIMVIIHRNFCGAIIRNAEALGGKNVSRDAAKKERFQSLFKSCQGVQVDDIVNTVSFVCSDASLPPWHCATVPC